MNRRRLAAGQAALLAALACGLPLPCSSAAEEPAGDRRSARPRRPVGEQEELFSAAVLGDAATVKRLLEKGVPPNFLSPHPSDPEALSPLAAAAGQGNVEVVRALLEAKVDVDLANAGGETALLYAAGRSGPITEMLIAAGAGIDTRDATGMSPVMRAVVSEVGAETLPVLLKAGADPDARQADGATATMIAAKNGKAELVSILAKAGADLEATFSPRQFTALVMAVTMKHAGAVDALLRAGAQVDHAVGGGVTPLMVAAASGDPAILDRLLAAGADVNRKADNGVTALAAAQQAGNAAAVAKLTAARASP